MNYHTETSSHIMINNAKNVKAMNGSKNIEKLVDLSEQTEFEQLERIVEINRVLHRDWNPIGVSAPTNEYLSYAIMIEQFIQEDAEEYFLAQYLDHVYRNNIIGKSSCNKEDKVKNFSSCVKVVKKIIKNLQSLTAIQNEPYLDRRKQEVDFLINQNLNGIATCDIDSISDENKKYIIDLIEETNNNEEAK